MIYGLLFIVNIVSFYFGCNFAVAQFAERFQLGLKNGLNEVNKKMLEGGWPIEVVDNIEITISHHVKAALEPEPWPEYFKNQKKLWRKK